jgi:hypothetical protein
MTLFRKVWRFCSAGMRCNWWQVFLISGPTSENESSFVLFLHWKTQDVLSKTYRTGFTNRTWIESEKELPFWIPTARTEAFRASLPALLWASMRGWHPPQGDVSSTGGKTAEFVRFGWTSWSSSFFRTATEAWHFWGFCLHFRWL